MTIAQAALLFAAAAVGGALNAVAGGGSFFTFPALIFAGVPPIPANATSTVALWPGSLASAVAYGTEVRQSRELALILVLPSVLGGLLGAFLLIRTPPEIFDFLLPALLLLATVAFAVGPSLTRAVHSRGLPRPGPNLFALCIVQLLISIYGGYFGGGMGLMMLAAFSVLGMAEIHRMNGLKSALAVAINGTAIVTFVLAGAVHWGAGTIMAVGAVVGGFFGARGAKRLPESLVRAVVVAVGLALSAHFGVRAWAD